MRGDKNSEVGYHHGEQIDEETEEGLITANTNDSSK